MGTISAPRKTGQAEAIQGFGPPSPPMVPPMRVVATSNDPVRLSFLLALLRDAGIGCVLLDGHASAVEGSIGAIQRRLAVAADDERQARRVLREAGEA